MRAAALIQRKEALVWLWVVRKTHCVDKDVAQKIARMIFSGFIPGVELSVFDFRRDVYLQTPPVNVISWDLNEQLFRFRPTNEKEWKSFRNHQNMYHHTHPQVKRYFPSFTNSMVHLVAIAENCQMPNTLLRVVSLKVCLDEHGWKLVGIQIVGERCYWTGPFGIYVDFDIEQIINICETHYVDQYGWSSAYISLTDPPPLTREEYLAKYATLEQDGHYWYKRPL